MIRFVLRRPHVRPLLWCSMNTRKMLSNILLYSVLYVGVLAFNEDLLVEVEQGILLGAEKVTTTKKDTYLSFKGIPYAKPPLGELRFQAPRPPEKWEGVRKALNHGPVCIQQSGLRDKSVIGSEDCLYLNVYTPERRRKNLMPVMFFIHGGAFITGSGNDDFYGPDYLMGYDVVLVTINYRLDALGFLSVDTKEVPGNAGLKDQIAALKWVKANINKFGGDPDQITIFGQSAGAACVTLHMISPVAKGLFRRAIPMSGNLYNDFAVSFAYVHRAFNLGDRLGYHTTDPYDLIKYLRNVPPEKLIATRPQLSFSDDISNFLTNSIYFTPVIEKELGGYHYLTEQPINLAMKGIFNNVDLLIGHAEAEGLRNVLAVQPQILEYYYNRKELYVPVKISNKKSISDVLEIGDKIEKHYFGNNTVTLNNICSFVNYYSYAKFVYEINFFINYIVPESPSTRRYFYIFALQCSRNVYSKPAGDRYGIYKATHRDDLPYLFEGSGYNITYDEHSEAVDCIDLMCRIFTNFAKKGDPSPDDSFDWPEYDRKDKKVVVIRKNLSVIQQRYSEELLFWQNIYFDAGIYVPYIGDLS